ncbi:MAG: TIGR00282 family metallophosphoesterase [Spirochaetales bacterium]|nr:MAG: TIGR00282 family metallophosphoesterase [Spirochaetales bacterium]
MPAKETISALILGDVVGQPGLRALFFSLKSLRKEFNADLVVINGENAADGYGITPEIAEKMFTSGVDVITSGNHIWQKREILPLMESGAKILRPNNYPPGTQGRGYFVLEIRKHKVAVVNLQGRQRLSTIDCPFQSARTLLKTLRNETRIILVDFHAEDTEEKEALGMYLDGQVSLVAGTHTHVQTADERILKGGTAYITDLGMTGPSGSVIGFVKEMALERALTQMPIRMEVSENPAFIKGVHVVVDAETGKAVSIDRVSRQSGY